MGFTHILFLLGAAAIVGPILAHLLNRAKYRKIPFTMLQFLELSQKQTQSKRKLHDFLILLLRCLIILLIAALFAGPVIYRQFQRASSKNIHLLLLDNSLSISCKNRSTDCFDSMVRKAKDYLHSKQGPENVFHLYATVTGCMGQDLTAEAAALLVDELKIQAGATDLSAFFADLKQIIGKKGRHDTIHIHTISDFTDEFMHALANQPGEGVDDFTYNMVAEDLNAENLTITDAHVINLKDDRLTLSATVANQGHQTVKRLVRADLNKTVSDEVFVNPSPGQQQVVLLTMDISEYLHKYPSLPVEIKLIPNDNLAADDSYFLGVTVQSDDAKKILLLGRSPAELFLIHTAVNTLKDSKNSNIHTVDLKTFSSFNPQQLFSYDIIIASTLDKSLGNHATALHDYLEAGGRCVFFVRKQFDADTAQGLYQKGILPALPNLRVDEISHLESLETSAPDCTSQENKILLILKNYQIDKIPLWSYSTCQQQPDAVTLWKIAPQASLLYQKKTGNGYCTLMNTSIDDADSGLTKSPAILPLIRYLLGFTEPVSDNSYACDETVLISAAGTEKQKQLNYIDAADKKHTVVLSENGASALRIPGPHPCGWIRTLTDPVRYIGIHPIANETVLKRPSPEQVRSAMEQIFHNQAAENAGAKLSISKETASLNAYFIGLTLFLIFLESFISNRMQRS